LAAIAQTRRPELGETPPVLIGEGISTLAYGWPSSEGGWVLRVSRQHPAPWTWRGGRAHEVDLAAELRRHGVPVPADATVIEEVQGLPTAILERMVSGTPVTPDLLRAAPRLTTGIAAVLDRLHAFDIDTAVVRGVTRDEPTAEFRRAMTVVDLADVDLRRRVEAAIAVLEGRTGIRTLCHRDFRVEHLIVADDGELAGLLDLGEIGVDDPAVDLAFLHGELGPAVVAEICASMETADAGLRAAAGAIHSLWPLLELAPGGESWGRPGHRIEPARGNRLIARSADESSR
jgi:aminoglycoside phosphotransferase (APT) family kinase protein